MSEKKSVFEPIISVVTVCFNAADVIENTICSVLSQEYSNFEYIIVDGGSNDGTVEIIRKYDSSVTKWISEPDKGIYDAMNKAVDMCLGKWVIFMNAGDKFFSSTVIRDVFCKEYSIGTKLIFGGVENRYSNGKNVIRKSKVENRNFLPFDICHQSCFFDLDLLKSIRYDLSYKICADAKLIHDYLAAGIDFEKVDTIISSYEASCGLSSKRLLDAKNEKIRILALSPHNIQWWSIQIKYSLRFIMIKVLGDEVYNTLYALYSVMVNNKRKNR